ncbi:S41 family peptidase [Algoriphagus sp. AK58]|uniref:S41 family peptidase n=1 Tax=Algoriphagus sp. AK58 TaxID=1406877 RepID=UPI00164FCD3A|nr:S41 family peptidase [Algoriphagus sp. AK58]MBC6368078.1 peptidase S41 [Algoriphagus sp. AK58]
MKKRVFQWALGLVFTLGLGACNQLFVEEDPENNFSNNFEILWKTLDQRYPFFEFKKINWDSIYQVYKPLAVSSKNDKEFFDRMAAMLSSLRDGHVNLRTPFDISTYKPYADADPNYSFDVLQRNYLGDYQITGNLINQEIDGVGYIHYRSFKDKILDSELDEVVGRFANLPGVVIDIRDNNGGNPENGLKMARRMISEPTHIYSYQNKTGPGRNDLGELKMVLLEPIKDRPMFKGRIVVLTNRTVFSAGSYFAAYMVGIPQAILMGDRSGGGSGVPAGHDLPNGWYFNFSSSIGYTVDGFNFENGVPVDIEVKMTSKDIALGKDPILERAIQYIKTGN